MPQNQGPVEVLSDTKNVDVHSYLREIARRVKVHWYDLIPSSARAPVLKRGTVLVDFRIQKNGDISDVRVANTSGDVYMDRAAVGGITTSTPFPALPRNFTCQFLALRFHFHYNPDPHDMPKDKTPVPTIPCVTTAIRVGGEIRIAISPDSAQVLAGSDQQFSALVSGDGDPAVKWSLTGPGCGSSDCGMISENGLYRAPQAVLKPLTVIVTATLAATPSEAASAKITIVQSPAPLKQ